MNFRKMKIIIEIVHLLCSSHLERMGELVAIIRILSLAIFGIGVLAIVLITTRISHKFEIDEKVAFYIAGATIIILAFILTMLSGESSGGIGRYIIAAMTVFGVGKSKEKEIFLGCQIPNPENTQVHDHVTDDKCLSVAAHNEESSVNAKDIAFGFKDEDTFAVKAYDDGVKKTKKVCFCKFCGGEIDDKTKRCTSCGKVSNPLRRFFGAKHMKLVLITILSLCLIGSVGVNIYSLQQIDTLEKKITTKDKKIRDLRTEYAGMGGMGMM